MQWLLVPSIALSLPTLAYGATQGVPEQRMLPCQPSQVSDLFPEPTEPRPELRVLITSFYGADEASEAYGKHVGSRMREEVESHARQEIKPEHSGLQYSAIRVKFVPCSIDDHEKARTLGQKAQADVVLWGKAFCSGKNPRACQTFIINSFNNIKDSPGATMKNQSGPVVVQPPDPSTPGRFTTSLTVVRWLGLEANAQSHGQLRRIDQVAALGLPELVSDKPRVLIDVVIGLYAARAKRHGLAAELLERAKQDVAAGVDGAADLYRLIGVSYLIAGRKEQGLANLEAALRACRSDDDRCQSVGLGNLGWAVARLGDKQQALLYFRRSLPLIQKVGDVSGEATTLNNIGTVYSSLGDKQQALLSFQRSLPLSQKVGDVSGEATTLNNIGTVYSDLGDKQQALLSFQRSLPLFQKVGDVSDEASTLNNIGMVYSDLGDKQQALLYFRRSLPLSQKVGDVSGEASTLNNIGTVYSSLGDKQQALLSFQRSLPLRQKVGDVSGEATTLSNIGAVYSSLGEKQQALLSFQRSLPLRQKVGDVSGEASTLNNIGAVYDDLGEKQQALQYYQRSLPLSQKVGDASGQATTLNNIGMVYSDLGDKQQALQYYQRSLPHFQKVGDVSGEGVTRDNIAVVLREVGQTSAAVASFRAAAACHLRRMPPDTQAVVSSLDLALSLALRARLRAEVLDLARQLDALDPNEGLKLLRQARVAGQTQAADAAVLYERLSALSDKLPPELARLARLLANAGLSRAQAKALFADCPGLVIMQVVPASQAERLDLRPGDILTRYQGTCLCEPQDLISATKKSQPEKPVKLERFRDGSSQTLTAQGGKLGVEAEAF